jgi:adenine-specific DNA-methyltransferase
VPQPEPLQQLQELLRRLFQLDLSDLDFGIYRLLRIKRDEVKAFLEEQLPRSVEQAFRSATGEERERLEEQIDALAGEIRDDIAEEAILPGGEINPEFRGVPGRRNQELLESYAQARERLARIHATDEQKREVFNHLYNFFRRYYEDGDFVPRHRYGARETYAVPYNGEETFFHWANRGQHYVKSAEVFRDYAFAVEGVIGGPYRVRFALTDASLPPGDTKGDTRYFYPLPGQAEWDEERKTLRLPFHYRLPTESEAKEHGRTPASTVQEEMILRPALPVILEAVPNETLRGELAAPESEEEGVPSLLLRHLRRFVCRNTSDYFIHRDLQGFLGRELEFYLKDQVLHLADLDGDFHGRARTLRVLRGIARDVIRFLAQIEEVQKRLFEKRKLVLRADYLVLIKDVPRKMWPEVLANPRQMEEWKRLFHVEPRKDLLNPGGEVNEGFLEEHPTLVVNTALFDDTPDFRDRVLESFENVDEATGGVLIQSENYQALRLLQRKYAGKVKCIYIDPPYNTGSDEFIYKDRYQHSSWLTMMEERLRLGRELLSDAGGLFVSIDDTEVASLRRVLDATFGPEQFLSTVVWQKRTSPDVRTPLSAGHDYILSYGKSLEELKLSIHNLPLSKQRTEEYRNPDNDPRGPWASVDLTGQTGHATPTQFYQITTPSGVQYDPPPGRCWALAEETFLQLLNDGRIWFGQQGDARPRMKKYLSEAEGSPAWTWWPNSEVGHNQEATKELTNVIGATDFTNPKPSRLIERILRLSSDVNSYVLDFFAGSGTSGQAVISLNRQDHGRRVLILTEMGEHFGDTLLPRIQRVIFSPEWRKGAPTRLPTADEVAHTPRLVKVLRLESYEDALHNLATEETLAREEMRAAAHRKAVGEEEYRLRYLARLPLAASASMLSIDRLAHPFRYTIEVLTDAGPERHPVDLVETFNLAYGLEVERLERWTNEEDGRLYRAVRARDRKERRVLVLWRDMEGLAAEVERRFLEPRIRSADPAYDEVWINGDSGIPGVHSLDPTFKRLIEEEEKP